jgi:hypothetical protein
MHRRVNRNTGLIGIRIPAFHKPNMQHVILRQSAFPALPKELPALRVNQINEILWHGHPFGAIRQSLCSFLVQNDGLCYSKPAAYML